MERETWEMNKQAGSRSNYIPMRARWGVGKQQGQSGWAQERGVRGKESSEIQEQFGT